jgi:hypothetical protein
VAVVAVGAAAAVLAVRGEREEAAPRPAQAPPTFTRPVDLCRALAAPDVGRLLGTAAPPAGRAGKAQCQWTVTGTGIALSAETDSDTPDPWSLTEESARTLLAGLQRQYGSGPRDGDWIWYQIGLNTRQPIIQSAPRTVQGVADEAFASDVSTPDGKAQATVVFFRLGDLVGRLQYADLDAASSEDVRRRAVEAAGAAVAGLRGLS